MQQLVSIRDNIYNINGQKCVPAQQFPSRRFIVMVADWTKDVAIKVTTYNE